MDVFIPEDIERCQDLNLKNDAIAAIARGTSRDMNRTFGECVKFNARMRKLALIEKRKNEFVRWKTYFSNPS